MSAPRSRRIVAAAADALAESARARLILETADGTLADADFAAYLAIEEQFVTTAARVVGYCLWAQDDWRLARGHAATVAHLVGPQLEWFADVRERYPLDAGRRDAALGAAAVLSRHLLDATARHGYWAAVTSLFAAETLYAGWCADAADAGQAVGDAADWVALHTGDDFLRGVHRLAEAVDLMPPEIDDSTAGSWFRSMLTAEDAFHAAVYAPSEAVGA